MYSTSPFRFSNAEKCALAASALSGVGVTLAVVRPGGGWVAPGAILLAALVCLAAGAALHFRERRAARRSLSLARLDTSQAPAEIPGPWSDVAPAA